MPKFTCEICGNSFPSDAKVAVCNGLNVRADENGNPVTAKGKPLPPGETLVVTGDGHAPTVMKRGK